MIKVITEGPELDILSEHLGLDIDEIQIWDDKVLFFWPHFWWFKHRSRMSIEKYNEIVII